MRTRHPRLVVIVGPTGVGKSRLAIELAEEFGGEIISADSMQVYKYMDIGTAKASPEEQRRIRHHLIDAVTPDQPFHAGLYRALAGKAIDDLHEKQRPIWVVGGTGLYIKGLTQGLFAVPKIDPDLRSQLKEEARAKGAGFLFQHLKKVDPKSASKLHPHDLVRTIRALEVFISTGVSISSYQEQHRFGESPYVSWKLGIEMTREEVYSRIEQRVDRMIEQGLKKEVEGLLERGYGPQLKPMQSLGYKQMVQFIRNEIGWDEAIHHIKRDTRHYAKRQWTWFKADPEISWRNGRIDRNGIFREVRSFLKGSLG